MSKLEKIKLQRQVIDFLEEKVTYFLKIEGSSSCFIKVKYPQSTVP